MIRSSLLQHDPTGLSDLYHMWFEAFIAAGSTHTHTCTHTHTQDIKNPPKVKDACDVSVDVADQEMGDINLYAIYANVCISSDTSKKNHFGQDPCLGSYVSE